MAAGEGETRQVGVARAKKSKKAGRVRKHQLRLSMHSQPDDTTCGPTCLQAVYQYFGDSIELEEVIAEVPRLEHGGTLEVLMGCHALRRGYEVALHTCNLKIFDPTWFKGERVDLVAKLEEQARVKRSMRLKTASQAYVEFLRLGGKIRFEVLTGALIRGYLNRDLPILTGLSSTYLYQSMREFGPDDEDDDIRGFPAGHFVVLSGYDRKHRKVLIADPLQSNPLSATRRYAIDIYHVLSAILLGVLTYDGNLLIIEPAVAAGGRRGA